MLEPPLGFEQEEMSQDDQSHMMMPTPQLIIAHAKFLFTILKAGFDRPAQTAEANELGKRGVGRSVAEVEFDFVGHGVSSEDEPDLITGQAVAAVDDPNGSKVSHKGAFAALFDGLSGPLLG